MPSHSNELGLVLNCSHQLLQQPAQQLLSLQRVQQFKSDCLLQTLDPTAKFSSTADVWSFNAEVDGAAVPFAQCCSDQGFAHGRCTCASRTNCAYPQDPQPCTADDC